MFVHLYFDCGHMKSSKNTLCIVSGQWSKTYRLFSVWTSYFQLRMPSLYFSVLPECIFVDRVHEVFIEARRRRQNPSGTGVTDCCERPRERWELNPGLLQVQPVLVNAELLNLYIRRDVVVGSSFYYSTAFPWTISRVWAGSPPLLHSLALPQHLEDA